MSIIDHIIFYVYTRLCSIITLIIAIPWPAAVHTHKRTNVRAVLRPVAAHTNKRTDVRERSLLMYYLIRPVYQYNCIRKVLYYYQQRQ